MATDQRPQVPTQDDYEEQAHDTRWVPLEDGDGQFQVVELPPLKLLRDMRDHGVDDLLEGEVEDERASEIVADGNFESFVAETVLPNIEQPNCYWSTDDDDDDDIGDGDFDLAVLTTNDLMLVITGMTGQDAEDLDEELEDTFQ